MAIVIFCLLMAAYILKKAKHFPKVILFMMTGEHSLVITKCIMVQLVHSSLYLPLKMEGKKDI